MGTPRQGTIQAFRGDTAPTCNVVRLTEGNDIFQDLLVLFGRPNGLLVLIKEKNGASIFISWGNGWQWCASY